MRGMPEPDRLPYRGPWAAARRVRRGNRWVYERVGPNSFESVTELMGWLTTEGYLVPIGDEDGMIYEAGKGWGDPYYAVAPEKAVMPEVEQGSLI